MLYAAFMAISTHPHEQPVADNEKLKVQIKKLEGAIQEAERSKREYMQNVAHQLAAPINAIKMNIESLEHPRIPFDRKRGLLRSIYAQGTILAHLIKNFSLMSHLEADHSLKGFREDPELVDVFLLCVNFTNDFQPMGKYKDQSIFVDEEKFDAAKRPKIFVIRNLFAQVIYNLLENATKYGDEGSEIIVGIRVDDKHITTTVTNSGPPILKEEMPKLFDRGYRGWQAARLHPAGTGFGLFIVRRIMEIHGGDVGVEVNGRQTTFLVKCPRNTTTQP